MAVEWRSIPGFPGYEASDLGQIRAVKSRVKSKQGLPLVPWIVERNGRRAAYVQLGRGNKQLVHRLVCLAFHGEPTEEQSDCCHKDHDSLNNTPANLRWDTHANNIQENYDRAAQVAQQDEGVWQDSPGVGVPF
jgi:hypothetical protein